MALYTIDMIVSKCIIFNFGPRNRFGILLKVHYTRPLMDWLCQREISMVFRTLKSACLIQISALVKGVRKKISSLPCDELPHLHAQVIDINFEVAGLD